MPNLCFRERKVGCWFCQDSEDDTYYGSILVSGLSVSACKRCAAQWLPGFDYWYWVRSSGRRSSKLECDLITRRWRVAAER